MVTVFDKENDIKSQLKQLTKDELIDKVIEIQKQREIILFKVLEKQLPFHL